MLKLIDNGFEVTNSLMAKNKRIKFGTKVEWNVKRYVPFDLFPFPDSCHSQKITLVS